jgi:phosphatidate cytidylyltransferase
MTRVISGVILAAIAVATLLYLPLRWLRFVAAAVALGASYEYIQIAGAGRGVSRFLVGIAVALACLVITGGLTMVDPIVVAVIVLAWVGVEVLFLGRTIHQAAVGVFAPFYIGVPLGMLVAIQDTLTWRGTLLLLATVVVSDSGQYYTGRAFGRRPLAPTISPKKTIEGAIGGVILGTGFMALAGPRVFPTLPLRWWLVGVTVVILGICGDLFESRLKRVAGMKDSSALIPGHGGILDRIDALLFAVPAFYLFVRMTA